MFWYNPIECCLNLFIIAWKHNPINQYSSLIWHSIMLLHFVIFLIILWNICMLSFLWPNSHRIGQGKEKGTNGVNKKNNKYHLSNGRFSSQYYVFLCILSVYWENLPLIYHMSIFYWCFYPHKYLVSPPSCCKFFSVFSLSWVVNYFQIHKRWSIVTYFFNLVL